MWSLSHFRSLLFSLEEGDKTQDCPLWGGMTGCVVDYSSFLKSFVVLSTVHLSLEFCNLLRGCRGFVFQNPALLCRNRGDIRSQRLLFVSPFFLCQTEEDTPYELCNCMKFFGLWATLIETFLRNDVGPSLPSLMNPIICVLLFWATSTVHPTSMLASGQAILAQTHQGAYLTQIQTR